MPSISDLATILREVASPGLKPKELIAAVREKHPEATKKEIVRAAFFTLSDGHEANAAQTGELHSFALKERGTDEEATLKPIKLKKKNRQKTAPQG